MITTINEYKKYITENNKTNTIYFRNFTQKCLWDNELTGQISDGHWSDIEDDNDFLCDLNTSVDRINPRIDATNLSDVNLDLSNKTLLDNIGDRMLCIAKMSKITTDESIIKCAEYLKGLTSVDSFIKTKTDNIGKYNAKYFNPISDELFQQFLNVNYTKANLITDLKDMSDIIKTTSDIENIGISGSKLDIDITKYIEYPGISFDKHGTFYINDISAGEFRFGGIEEHNGTDYVVSEMVWLKDQFKRKGIYSAIIQGAVDYGKATGKADGVISYQFDMSSEQERSRDADLFWEGLVSKGKAVSEDFFDGEEDTTVYYTI